MKVRKREYQLLDGSQRELVQRVGDGSIITRFEKTPLPNSHSDAVCPHFLELKWATGCPFSCVWCYLNGTLRFPPWKTQPRVKPYDKIEIHVRSFLGTANGSRELLNAGELSDSLMHERNGNPFSRFIVSLLQEQHQHKVLLLTKSTHIQNLLDMRGQEHAVVSFSLNADSVAKEFEKSAPAVADRLTAAKALNEAGYEVRVRIDPMVPVPSWREDYLGLIDDIFDHFAPSRVTLGSLRGLQSTINMSVDKSWVSFLSEGSNWGKRVDADTRSTMYGALIQHMGDRFGYSSVGLCKETVEVWGRLGMDYRTITCNCIL